jgi:hypothetical protein
MHIQVADIDGIEAFVVKRSVWIGPGGDLRRYERCGSEDNGESGEAAEICFHDDLVPQESLLS